MTAQPCDVGTTVHLWALRPQPSGGVWRCMGRHALPVPHHVALDTAHDLLRSLSSHPASTWVGIYSGAMVALDILKQES
jgi:hypothetical protein